MKVKPKEIRQMSEALLNDKLLEVRKELMKLNSQIAVGTVPENPGKIKQLKKTIARMLTILREKELSEPKAKKAKTKEESKKQ